VGPRPGTALHELRTILLKIPNGGLQVIHLKTQVVDGTRLSPNHMAHFILFLSRLRVTDEFKHRIPHRHKGDLGPNLLDFDDLCAGQTKSLKLLYGAFKILDNNPYVTYLLWILSPPYLSF
jgi:hypothetical protein